MSAPARSYQFPKISQVHQWEAPLLDKIGEVVRRHRLPLAVGAIGGAVAGVLITRQVLDGTIARQAAYGAAGAFGGALALGLTARRMKGNLHAMPVGEGAKALPPTAAVASEKVKVLTYNVHGGMGAKGMVGAKGKEFDRLADVIRRESPDIVILQELDRMATRSNFRYSMHGLAKRLHPDSAVTASPGTLATGRTQSVGIMTFNGFRVDGARNLVNPDPFGGDPIRRARGWVLDVRKALHQMVLRKPLDDDAVNMMPSYFPRNTIDGLVVTPKGNALRVLGAHYSGPTRQVDYQSEQVAPLAMRLREWRGPTIFGADFNVWSGGATGEYERRLLGSAGMRDTFSAVGIRPGDPRRRSSVPGSKADLDRIYVSQHLHVNDTRVVPEPDNALASDHRPVVTELTVMPKPPKQPTLDNDAATIEPPPPSATERPTGQPLIDADDATAPPASRAEGGRRLAGVATGLSAGTAATLGALLWPGTAHAPVQ